MADYIERKDAIKWLQNIRSDCGRYQDMWHYAEALDQIIELLSADVAPVVRCKDCLYYQDNNNGYPHNECRWRSDETPDVTDFCSFGERKDDE